MISCSSEAHSFFLLFETMRFHNTEPIGRLWDGLGSCVATLNGSHGRVRFVPNPNSNPSPNLSSTPSPNMFHSLPSSHSNPIFVPVTAKHHMGP